VNILLGREEVSPRVPNDPRKSGLDQLVWWKFKSSLMVETRPTGRSGLLDRTRPGLVPPGPPSNRICTALFDRISIWFCFLLFLSQYITFKYSLLN